MLVHATLFSLFSILVITPPAISNDDFLPTPYTAEQIRDAWKEGLRITNRTRTPGGETMATTTVVKWSKEKVTFAEQTLNADGTAAGEPTTGTATWAELRDHARFPVSTTSREHVNRKTAYGEIEGWLYTTSGDGSISNFFFADEYPGSPLYFSSSKDGTIVFEVAQIARTEPEN